MGWDSRRPCSSANPVTNGICFCEDQPHIENCLKQGVAILVVSPALTETAAVLNSGSCAILSSAELHAAMAKLNTAFFLPPWGREVFGEERTHPSATIHPSAKLHGSVVVQPNAVIGTDGFGYGTDKNGQHFAKPHFGKVILEDRVEIGCSVHVDRGTFEDTVIGEGTKIDNHCHFAHNTIIGKNCLITAGFIVAGSSSFGDHCKFAGRVSANGHISVCDNVTMGPVSVISKNITVRGMYGGFPPVAYKDFIKK